MAFDAERGISVVFGGADATSVRSDTWAWNGSAWTRDELPGPSGRTFPAMVWDAGREEALLFGGRRVLFGKSGERETVLGDTWLLKRGVWRLAAVAGPPARTEAGIAYDSRRKRVVLFGGYSDAGATIERLGDTWEWDGRAWHLASTSGPAPRSGLAMAYDPRLERVVLFGGNGGPRSDTWVWDGRLWTPVPTDPVPGRFNSLLVYDAARRQLLRTTGWDGKGRVGETWLFEAAAWRHLAVDGPGPRNHSGAVFDTRRRRLVMFGGHDGDRVFGDVWEWDGRRWRETYSHPPQKREDNGH